jgi:hypothetical protein
MTEIIAPISEAVLVESREEVVVVAPQEIAVVVEVRTEAAIITPQPEVLVIEVRRGPVGPVGPAGPDGARGQTDYPDGVNTGDIIRYNAATGNWESCVEPFEFKGIVLVPTALPGAPVDGQVGFNIADNALYVAVP